jgi:hypothetical protein
VDGGGVANANIIDALVGLAWMTPVYSLYANSPLAGAAAADQTKQLSVGFMVARAPNMTDAMSQLNGNDIFVKPVAAWFSETSNLQNYEGTLLHEVLHNVTGLTDPDIQKDLGIGVTPNTVNITNKLMDDCL